MFLRRGSLGEGLFRTDRGQRVPGCEFPTLDCADILPIKVDEDELVPLEGRRQKAVHQRHGTARVLREVDGNPLLFAKPIRIIHDWLRALLTVQKATDCLGESSPHPPVAPSRLD